MLESDIFLWVDGEDSTPTQEYGAVMLLFLLFVFLFCESFVRLLN
jgi:hypothetical protein